MRKLKDKKGSSLKPKIIPIPGNIINIPIPMGIPVPKNKSKDIADINKRRNQAHKNKKSNKKSKRQKTK